MKNHYKKPYKHEWLHNFPLCSFILNITAQISIICRALTLLLKCSQTCSQMDPDWQCRLAACWHQRRRRSLWRVKSGRHSQVEPLVVLRLTSCIDMYKKLQLCCSSIVWLTLVSECVTFDSSFIHKLHDRFTNHTLGETCEVLLDCFIANIAMQQEKPTAK